MRRTIQPTMLLREAAKLWLDDHRADIRERTATDYEFYVRNLAKVLGDKPLSAVALADVLDYQRVRRQTVGHEVVNHEVCTLRQILQKVDLWHPISRHYKPLKAPQWTPPKVLTAEEEERFFKVTAGKLEWRVAYWACMLANNTSAIGAELRFLQLRHILLDHTPPIIRVNDARVKNEFRARSIPLNPPALEAVQGLVDRARSLGACRQDHYLFPFRVKKGEYDVTRPASPWFIRSAFRSMRKATGLDWFQHRNLRNQVITKLFESGAPDETITSIAGHQAIRMSRYYSRVRIEARADALNCLAGKAAPTKAQETPKVSAPALSVMREAALLVKETGIDAATALSIVREMRNSANVGEGPA
ncbi:MAG TPA: tyrosine-type recombinase/integrase [Candidatus Angelobacter sp.]|nr:tyrosine-type recombinase/integrase [Candidatus Angelobacter sp.]